MSADSTPPARPRWLEVLRAHWLVLAALLLYIGRWGQYVYESRAYRSQATASGAGDALGWLLLRQPWLAGLLALVLLANAIWRPQGRWFYVLLLGVLALPFLIQFFIEG